MQGYLQRLALINVLLYYSRLSLYPEYTQEEGCNPQLVLCWVRVKVIVFLTGEVDRSPTKVNVLLPFCIPRVHTRRGVSPTRLVLCWARVKVIVFLKEKLMDSTKVSINLIYVLLYYSRLSLYPEFTQEEACHPPGWCCVERGWKWSCFWRRSWWTVYEG